MSMMREAEREADERQQAQEGGQGTPPARQQPMPGGM